MPALLVLLAVLVVAPSTACATGTWTAQTSGTTDELRSVSFTDSSHGWATSSGGTILATTDGGAHWVTQTSGTTSADCVRFVDAAHGWAVGVDGTILATTDGGAHWVAQTSGTNEQLVSVSFTDSLHGWAAGSGWPDAGFILATTDGGAHWVTQPSGTTQGLNSVFFTDSSHGWATGDEGTILATVDGGAHWTPQASGTTASMMSVSFTDSSHGWATGSGGTILATTDGGAHWVTQTSGTTSALFGVSFVDAAHGWAVGGYDIDGGAAGSTILATNDGGAHWTAQPSPAAGVVLTGVASIDTAHAWAVGSDGAGYGTILTYSEAATADTTPPKTTSNAVTYYANSATIRLTASDNSGGSGIAHTYYRLNGAAQVASSTVRVSKAGTYSLVYSSVDASGNVEAAHTVRFTVIAKPSSGGTPSTPASIPTLTRGKSFAVYGYIVKHTAGVYPVTLQFYRYQSGHWVLRKTSTGKASNMLTFSKYSRSTSVPYSGKWRVRAQHKVGTKYLYSGYRTFTAK